VILLSFKNWNGYSSVIILKREETLLFISDIRNAGTGCATCISARAVCRVDNVTHPAPPREQEVCKCYLETKNVDLFIILKGNSYAICHTRPRLTVFYAGFLAFTFHIISGVIS
jgi:hypothetical protein